MPVTRRENNDGAGAWFRDVPFVPSSSLGWLQKSGQLLSAVLPFLYGFGVFVALERVAPPMIENQKLVPAGVLGPLGEILTLEALPEPSTARWTIRRKAEVVAAVDGGLLTIDDVLERYKVSLEEFVTWRMAIERWGMNGLRATKVKHYRDIYERQNRY